MLLLASALPMGAPLGDARQDAVALARQGNTGQALQQLSALYERNPSPILLYDLITIAEWHGDHERVRELSTSVDADRAPDWALAAIARAFAAQDRPSEAADWFDACARRSTRPLDCSLAATRSQAAASKLDRALERLDRLARSYPQRPEVPATRAALLDEAGRWSEAAVAWRRAAARAPTTTVYTRAQLDSLLAAGDIAGARELMRQYPLAVTPAQRERVRGDEATRAIRALRATPEEDPGRETLARRVVRLLDRNVALAEVGSPEWRRAHYDRIVAYESAGLPRQALRARERLPGLGLDEPAYVTEAACRALEALGDARLVGCLESLVDARPDDASTRRWLFHAYLEAERFDEALATIDALAQAHPDGPDPRTAAVARAWLDDLPEAEGRLRELAAREPGDTAVRTDLATIERWRGWPRSALATAQDVLADAPEATGARAQAAHALMDLGAYGRADRQIRRLAADGAAPDVVAELEDRHRRDTGWGVSSDIGVARSDGPIFGGREAGAQTRIESPLITDSGRFVARHHYEWARFPEGNAARNHFGLGWRERRRAWHGFAEVHSGATDGAGLGVAAGVTWTPDDHWYLSAGLDSDTVDAPLRGRRQGIGAEALSLAAGYRWHERRKLNVRGSALDFDDGNERRAVGASLTQRLYTHPRGWLDGNVSLYGSTNTSDDSPFFNPSSDSTAALEVIGDWRNRDWAPQRLRQRVSVHAGSYEQEGFDAAAIGGIRYSHRWRLTSGNSFRYGLYGRERVYDGTRERQLGIFLGFEWRRPWSR